MGPRRTLATHRETPASSLLSNTLDRGSPTSASGRLDTIGPFPLDMRGPSSRLSQTKPKPWSELNARGKVARGTARTTNLTVILIGGAFTCVLAYALATELFAPNSPSRLYEDACRKLGESPEVARHLKHPLKFHINAPSVNAPRHRSRHVSSQLAVDQSGQEHLLLHFYVESIPPVTHHEPAPLLSDSDVTLESVVDWVKTQANDVVDSSKRAFAFVVGIQQSATSSNSEPQHQHQQSMGVRHTNIGKSTPADASSAWSFAGLFSGLRGIKPASSTDSVAAAGGGTDWTEGEVHADLVKDAQGNFQYRYLLVDIPHSKKRKPLRVYVEKGSGFREGEGVFVWGS